MLRLFALGLSQVSKLPKSSPKDNLGRGKAPIRSGRSPLRPYISIAELFSWHGLMVLLWLCLGVFVGSTVTQTIALPQPGDSPIAALIDVSVPDETGSVTITGAEGAILPAAEVAVQNLYTGVTAYAYTGLSGSFRVQIPASGSTPFWISPSPSIPVSQHDIPGAPPGGPGVIVYGPPAESIAPALPITQLCIDGNLNDWHDYVSVQLGTETYALANTESLYIGTFVDMAPNTPLTIAFTIDDSTYELALVPSLPQTALLRQMAPSERDMGTDSEQGIVEMRLPLSGIATASQQIVLESINTRIMETTVPRYDEQDGLVYSGGMLAGRFD